MLSIIPFVNFAVFVRIYYFQRALIIGMPMYISMIFIANALGLSGLIAVATADLYFGNVTMRKESSLSKKVQDTVSNFWDISAFLC